MLFPEWWRDFTVGVRTCLGCKWSLVQIQSPRLMEGPEVPRESGGLGAFVFGHFGALHYRCINSHGDAEGERPVHVGPEVLQVAVVVHGGGDLRRRVAEVSLDRAEVDAGLPEQRRVRVAQIVEPELPRDGRHPEAHLALRAPRLAGRVPTLLEPAPLPTADVPVARDHPGPLERPPEVIDEVEPDIRREGGTVGPGEHEIRRRGLHRRLEVRPELAHDGHVAGVPVLRQRRLPGVAHRERPGPRVHVGLEEPQRLARSQARVDAGGGDPAPGRVEIRGRKVRQRWQDLAALQHASRGLARLGNPSPLHPADRVLGRPGPVLRVARSLEHVEDRAAKVVQALGREFGLLPREQLIEPVGEEPGRPGLELLVAQLAEVLLQKGEHSRVHVPAPRRAVSRPPPVEQLTEREAVARGRFQPLALAPGLAFPVLGEDDGLGLCARGGDPLDEATVWPLPHRVPPRAALRDRCHSPRSPPEEFSDGSDARRPTRPRRGVHPV